jgi:G3E family GTPase
MNKTPLPVTVISGFVGAGKTALLDTLVDNPERVRIGTVSEQSIEAIEQAIVVLAEQACFDAIVVESPATLNPIDIAEELAFGDDDAATLSGRAHLDTFVTVIDAHRFLHDYASAEAVDPDDEDGKTIVETLIEQIEFCDVIVINKTDLASADDVEKIARVLHALNPRAHQVRATNGQISPNEVLNTARFDFDTTSSAPGWLAILHGDHVSEEAFVYRARRPFHPERLWNLLHEEWTDVLRAKGFFWLATRSEVGGALSQAGSTCRHGPAGVWWAAQDRSEWPTDDPELEAEIVAEWYGDADDNSIGDRRQALVLIGLDLDEPAWQARFDACLLNDEEWSAGPSSGQHYIDPFPAWEIDDHDHDHDHDEHEHGPDCGCDDHQH